MDSSVGSESLDLKNKIPISITKVFTPRLENSIFNMLEDLRGSLDNQKKQLSMVVTRRSRRFKSQLKSQNSSPKRKKVEIKHNREKYLAL
jgi:hypothetical protein